MTKLELASYCASILAIMSSKEDAGRPRGGWLAAEYERSYAELKSIIKKENEHASRQSLFDRHRGEERADG